MSTPIALPTAGRQIGRSSLAIIVAFVADTVLSLVADQILHMVGFYPPWGVAMRDPTQNAVALAYRIVFGVVAGVIVARLAPRAPMRHAAILGAIGFAVATLGAVVTITQFDLGPAWFPIALAVTSFPAVWLGAAWYVGRRAA